MPGLQYLKYIYNESDEAIVQKFAENLYYQYFCGNEYFKQRLPIDSSSITKFRGRMGKESIEKLFKETVASVRGSKQLKEKHFEHVNVDTTVQGKAISFPTDAKLDYKMLQELEEEAKSNGISLRQSYKYVSKKALMKQAGFAHARQMNRSRKMTRKFKTYLGRDYRDLLRSDQQKSTALESKLALAEKLLTEVMQKLIYQRVCKIICVNGNLCS